MIKKQDNGTSCRAEKYNDNDEYIGSLTLNQSGKIARDEVDAQLKKMDWGDETATWEIKK